MPKRTNRDSLLDPDEILVDSVSALGGDHMEARMERPLGRTSSILFLLCAACGLAYLLFRAGELQIASGKTFFEKSQENRFLTRFIYPPRGVIFDRFGTPLAENLPSLDVLLERDEFLRTPGVTLPQFLDRLEKIFGRDPSFFAARDFLKAHGQERMPDRIVIAHDVSLDAVLSLQARQSDFPGIHVAERFQRVYRNPYAYAHVLGFVGRVTEEDRIKNPELRGEENIGRSGVEAQYDAILRGSRGKKIIEVDSSGSETRFKVVKNPEEGPALRLSLDAGLQEAVHSVLAGYTDGKKGASVVILDAGTGAVRSLVSYPGFDSNKFASSISQDEFQSLVHDPLFPFFNRAIAGEFPSGSVIKPIIGAAALNEKIIDPEKKIYAEESISVQNPYNPDEVTVFRDWKKHGWIDFYDAIAQSANVYFYTIGGGYGGQEGLGISRIKKYASFFGLGARLGIDMPGEEDGLFPDPSYKQAANPNDPAWRAGDTYNVSIGQGGVRVTPLQMAAAVAALANGGTLFRPYLAEAVLDGEGTPRSVTEPRVIQKVGVSPDVLKEVGKGMRKAVTNGTAWRLSGLPIAVAAKTGTAQVGNRAPHAWVTAYAPYENPRIAAVVMVEHAGEGATVAVPIMHDILEWYFSHRKDDLSIQSQSPIPNP